MRPFFPAVEAPALTVAFLLLFVFSGCASSGQTAEGETGPSREDHRLVAKTSGEGPRGEPEGKTLSAIIPARDVRGEPVCGLPRFPGSVQVGYSESRVDGLALVRAEYMTEEGTEAVRGYYRDVFRSGRWGVANVEFSSGGWEFLVVRGGLEAEVAVVPRGGGSEVSIELSGPSADGQASAGGSKR